MASGTEEGKKGIGGTDRTGDAAAAVPRPASGAEARAEERHRSKTRLLEAALTVIRTKGYTATRVEDVCEAAGLTKGSFFHHFKTKEELAVAAADYWSQMTDAFFADAPYHAPADPLERVLGYIDFRREILSDDVPEFTCLVGTMVQEIYETAPAIRDACDRSISGHAAELEKDIAAAKALYAPDAEWTPESLALHTQAVIQGSFILAKARMGAEVAAQSIGHLRTYVEMLMRGTKREACRDAQDKGDGVLDA
jgi:TetR/AcrR family transcriptional repressor of nem operon